MSAASGNPIHCDPSILHAPGECEFCDKYGKPWQEYRELARINFTGHTDDDKAPCPSTHFRPAEVAHRWPGNQPQAIATGVTWLNLDGSTSFIMSDIVSADPVLQTETFNPRTYDPPEPPPDWEPPSAALKVSSPCSTEWAARRPAGRLRSVLTSGHSWHACTEGDRAHAGDHHCRCGATMLGLRVTAIDQ